MEMIRGRESDCRQKVRSAVERGGTHPSRRVDPQRQAFRPAADEGRILLKADISELGEGWSDSRIAAALDTSIATIERTRRQLVEEGFEAVLRRKYNPIPPGRGFSTAQQKQN
jgi:hypothetical protein